MEKVDWLQMLEYQQELHHFFRALLAQGHKGALTASELELLALLYLQPEDCTPLVLSRQSGMKKEAVSRCIRQLYEKAYICKSRHPQDERSYILSLTDTGKDALRNHYMSMPEPLYTLRCNMGERFDLLFELIGQANAQLGK